MPLPQGNFVENKHSHNQQARFLSLSYTKSPTRSHTLFPNLCHTGKVSATGWGACQVLRPRSIMTFLLKAQDPPITWKLNVVCYFLLHYKLRQWTNSGGARAEGGVRSVLERTCSGRNIGRLEPRGEQRQPCSHLHRMNICVLRGKLLLHFSMESSWPKVGVHSKGTGRKRRENIQEWGKD